MNLIFGGSGVLGTELQKYLPGTYLSSQDCNICEPKSVRDIIEKHRPTLVVNLAAYTNVAEAERNESFCFAVNIGGASNVVLYSPSLVYLSSDYVNDPVNVYARSKKCGEEVSLSMNNGKVIRTSFKPSPFPHARACTDLWSNADYVDVIAPMIADAIEHYAELPLITHVGTERKSIFELAKRRRRDVLPMVRADIKSVALPYDTSVDPSRLWKGSAKPLVQA